MLASRVRLLFCLLAIASHVAGAASPESDPVFPPDSSRLKSSSLPGYRIALQKCGICHSADYINLQPPGMTTPQWTAETVKMQHTYGAPLEESEIALVGEYLGVTYGGQETSAPSASVAAASVSMQGPAQAPGGNVQALLERHACLTCHAVDSKIVGPAYRDVATKYRKDARALLHIEASIRSGGKGKWGDVPMPPYDTLSGPELKALAQYVMRQ